MDAIIPLLIMLVLYLVPELLKRRRNPKEYKYPDIPEKFPTPADVKIPEIKAKPIIIPVTPTAEPPQATWSAPPKPVMPAPVNVPSMNDSISPWHGKLSPQLVQNGLIFAEILQPPRAYRPLLRRQK